LPVFAGQILEIGEVDEGIWLVTLKGCNLEHIDFQQKSR